MRDYTEIIERLNTIDNPSIEIGKVDNHPILQLRIESTSDSPKDILITSGIHGDEPAGVETALQFLERDNRDLLQTYSFVIIPCINPFGYVHNIRENSEGIDINRSFETDKVDEANIVKRALDQQQFLLTIDFHEDYDANGFYLYEGNRDEQYIGPELVKFSQSIGPLDSEDSGEDASQIAKGVYKVNETWGTQGLAPYLLHHHCSHVLISETPTNWLLQQRVDLHLSLFDTALKLI